MSFPFTQVMVVLVEAGEVEVVGLLTPGSAGLGTTLGEALATGYFFSIEALY
jgi:hypothetical protein